MNPEPKTVLIVGTGRGIGRAVALHLAASTDWRLILASRTDTVYQTASDCGDIRYGCATPFRWDVADMPTAELERALERAETPLALVYAAGILGSVGPLESGGRMNLAAWRRVLHVNLFGAANAMSLCLGWSKASRIVVFAGGGSCQSRPGYSAYAASKAGLLRLVETVADEVRDRNVWVTAVAPGACDTDMLRESGEQPNTDINEPCRLVHRLLTEQCGELSGRLVHVRDEWPVPLSEDAWKLRRVQA